MQFICLTLTLLDTGKAAVRTPTNMFTELRTLVILHIQSVQVSIKYLNLLYLRHVNNRTKLHLVTFYNLKGFVFHFVYTSSL